MVNYTIDVDFIMDPYKSQGTETPTAAFMIEGCCLSSPKYFNNTFPPRLNPLATTILIFFCRNMSKYFRKNIGYSQNGMIDIIGLLLHYSF